jgi:hypothetical protein
MEPVCVPYDEHAAAAAADGDACGGAPLLSGALHVAPMLAVTDRHFRQLCRLASRRAVLWSEMVHADAVLHNAAALLPYDRAFQQPCVLQLGGSSPATLARASEIGASAEYGYDEINLNVRSRVACFCVLHFAFCVLRLRLHACVPPRLVAAPACVCCCCASALSACLPRAGCCLCAARVRAAMQCGCPSGKVCHKKDSSMCFGARLMLDPEHTGECLR